MSRYHDNAEVSVGDGLLRYTDDYAVPDFEFFSTWGKPKRNALETVKAIPGLFFFVYIMIHQRHLRTISDSRVTKEVVHASLAAEGQPQRFGPKSCLGPGFYRWVAVNITSRGKRGGMEEMLVRP